MDVSSPRTEALSMEPSAKLFCCGFVRRCIPLVYREELYHILRMTGPLLVCRFLNFLLFFVVTMFCGRLGNTVLAGYAMASATINVTAAATGLGLALACDTLVSQTFGSKNLLRVGVILQRGILILTLFSLPCWALLVNTQPLLLYLGQDPEVARIAQLYVVAFLPAIPPTLLAEAIYTSSTHQCLVDIDNITKDASYATRMLSEVDLAAQHVVIMLAYINYKIPLGMQGAACVRVGNALGAGETAAAILTSKVSLISAAVIAIFQGFILGSTKTVIGYIFTSDEAIAELVSQLLNIYCPLQFFNGILSVGMGILLGTGQQKIAAIANLFGYYCIGLPTGIVLMFTAKLQVAGFWLGLLIAVFLLAIFFVVAIFKLNWKKMTEEAIERTGKSANGAANGAMTPNHRNSIYQVVLNAENGNGYVVVGSHDQDEGLNHTVVHEGPNVTHMDEKPAVLLSTAQLILRRGLTTLAALLILAVGIAVHLTVPLPNVSYGAGANFTSDSNFTTATPI
ncbi:multidrug and toxin extrusion protein 1-like [Sinocyclocheilus rhinocerous]|uniref:multidrug and toxin extrusion protein 1-like n=1 Tax=Sinocyclocheilus rhinocerous TaxID=307959 RepID=UPI0007B97539|nr:PREDICTED: multidrug and toxin extrusion protein 1-like [Sinocyclocheilus rhinocerous]